MRSRATDILEQMRMFLTACCDTGRPRYRGSREDVSTLWHGAYHISGTRRTWRCRSDEVLHVAELAKSGLCHASTSNKTSSQPRLELELRIRRDWLLEALEYLRHSSRHSKRSSSNIVQPSNIDHASV